ncbi:MAG: hypothetical protein QM804_00150 [Propionicimonas sp.]
MALLDACGEVVKDSDPAATVRVVRSELRLQATDFWLRNPDYLADELLTLVESGDIDAEYVETARSLLEDPEPDLRWYPMPKWLHGAYEPLDDAFSVLETYGLALAVRRGTPGHNVAQTQFFLTVAGAAAVTELSSDPVLGWYAKQVKLVAKVAGDDHGKALKDRQYLQATYANTQLGLNIGPIADRVMARLAALDAREGKS